MEHVFFVLITAFTYMDQPSHTWMGFQNLHSDSNSIPQISVVSPMTLPTETRAIFMRNHWLRSCCVIACFSWFISLGLPLLCSCFCCREWINASRCYCWYFFGPMQMSYCASVLENGWTGVCLGCDRRIYCCTTIIWEAMSGHSLPHTAHKQSTDLISILHLTEPQLCTTSKLRYKTNHLPNVGARWHGSSVRGKSLEDLQVLLCRYLTKDSGAVRAGVCLQIPGSLHQICFSVSPNTYFDKALTLLHHVRVNMTTRGLALQV